MWNVEKNATEPSSILGPCQDGSTAGVLKSSLKELMIGSLTQETNVRTNYSLNNYSLNYFSPEDPTGDARTPKSVPSLRDLSPGRSETMPETHHSLGQQLFANNVQE